jgi:hypothetical protein
MVFDFLSILALGVDVPKTESKVEDEATRVTDEL